MSGGCLGEVGVVAVAAVALVVVVAAAAVHGRSTCMVVDSALGRAVSIAGAWDPMNTKPNNTEPQGTTGPCKENKGAGCSQKKAEFGV